MLRIHAVGGFRVEVDGWDRTSATPDRATALLAWLALNPGSHRRSAVAAQFWPDVLDESARASLRSALWSLRRRLGEANGALIATRDHVGLSDEVWVDLAEAERLRADGRLDEALRLGGGELLPGLEDEWAYEARDAHRAWTAALLEELAERADGDGDTRGAIELSRRSAALDPLSEEAHRSLMRRLADAGDRPGALTVYSELRSRLLKTLRIGPSDETRELAESLRAPPGGELVPMQLKRVDRALFVGREAELARLRRLREAVSETTRVGLIAGEAGSGKTRLAARFAVETAAVDGTAVLYGSCGEQALVPLEPFAEALGSQGEPGVDAALVEDRLAAVPGSRLLLVLDDLQWADRVTLALLCRIARGPLSSRLILIGTYREDAADAPLYGALADIRRNCDVVRVELGGLGVAEVAALIGSAFETSAAAAEARTIHNRTGGNPFYVRELARHVAERPATAFVDVPEGIRDVVRARLKRLSAGCADTLGAAAVLGDSFEVLVLAAVTGTDEEELQRILDEVAEAGLVEEVSAGRYRFAHRLTRDAVYKGLGPSRRARLHTAAAAALAEQHGLEPGRRLGEIALHRCEAAGETGDAEAVDLAADAASLALDEGAYEQAVALLTRALAVVPDGDVERRRKIAGQRARAFARLTHAILDTPG